MATGTVSLGTQRTILRGARGRGPHLSSRSSWMTNLTSPRFLSSNPWNITLWPVSQKTSFYNICPKVPP